ncbi:MAG: hypothetical protein N2506_06385 [Dehalococcoidales bacterium]|nr:hypothetical protein [Dehalococcoidales bacterium]
MSESRKKVLEMLAQGKIGVDDALRLLDAINGGGKEKTDDAGARSGGKPRYLRVTVSPPEGTGAGQVNVRVPMGLLRAGLKFTSLIPSEALDKASDAMKEKGINLDLRNLRPEDIEELIGLLSDLEVDVVTERGEKVKVFAE